MAGLLKPVGRLHAGQGAEGGGGAADPLPHPRHQRRRGGEHPRRRRAPGSTRSTRRWTASRATPRSPASARSSRRCGTPSATPGSTSRRSGRSRTTGRRCATQYAAFEAGLKAPASEVYLHEMPGGQFTNLKAQARSMGLEERWHEVAQMYAEVNQMFGDIVKVTPSSKVVGDMALMMVAQGLTRAAGRGPGRRGRLPRERRRHDARQPRPAAGRLAARRCRRRC